MLHILQLLIRERVKKLVLYRVSGKFRRKTPYSVIIQQQFKDLILNDVLRVNKG